MKRLVLLTIISFTVLASCLTSSREIEKRLELRFQAERIAEDLIVNGDTLFIEEFKFALDQFILRLEDGTELISSENVSTIILSYDQNGVGDRLVLSTGIGFDVSGFNNYELSITPVPDGSNIFDTDFVDGGNFSFIVYGKYNGEDFEYFSSLDFDGSFDFPSVELTDLQETLFLRNLVRMDSVFTDDQGNLIDPNDEDRSLEIEANFRNALRVEAFAGSIVR